MNFELDRSQAGASMLKMPSLKERLERAVQEAEEKLKIVQEAREIFDKNPDLERLLDLMQRGHF